MALENRIFVYEYLSGGGEMAGTEAASELLSMGQAMRDAIAADLLALETYHVTVATCKLAASAPRSAHPAAPRDGEPADHFVRRQAALHDLVWVVAPETDGLLASLHACALPSQWLGCDLPAIELATRKRKTLVALAAAGIATPAQFEHAPDIDRWVVKPDDGAGAVATRVHRRRPLAWDDWRTRMQAGLPTQVEPWIDGEAMSLSLLCGARRCDLLSINRQHLEVDSDGMLSFAGVEVNTTALTDPRAARLADLAARVHAAVAGLRGFVGIDLVWHATHGPVVIEVNPRVTCAYVGLSHALRRNLAADVINACADQSSFEAAHGHA